MDDAQFLKILNTRYDLLEEFACLLLIQPLFLDDVIKKLSFGHVFGDQVELFWGLDDFIQLDDIGMSCQFQNLDLPRHSFNVNIFYDLMFFKYFNSYFFSCNIMHAQFDLAKGTLAYCLANLVMTDRLRLRLRLFLLFLRPVPWLGMVPVFALFCGSLYLVIYLI